MNINQNKKLDNPYVEKYYDAQVASLPGSYADDRWHSSPVREFEYQQTARALKKALSGCRYEKAIEIGPGDGVWTNIIHEFVTKELHLVEQSTEMFERARSRLAGLKNVTFERSDFLTSNPPAENDLIVAVRCFEYFENKEEALKKMRKLLSPGGRIVIITKNAELVTSSSVQHHKLHSDQVSRYDMRRLAASADLTIMKVYPAVMRWKASYAPMRFLFDFLQKVAVWSQGTLVVPFLSAYATESHVYVMHA